MTSLFDYYHSQSYKHISSQSKKAIRSSVFSHIKLQHQAQTSHTSSPSRWTLLTSYQTHRRYRYVYTSLALIGIVSGIYFTDTRPQISYLAWGPVIQTQTHVWPNTVYANELGTIISTSGKVEIIHQNWHVSWEKLYGGDTLLLSNKSYLVFELAWGYVWSVSGPAKIELYRVQDSYHINVIEGTIFKLKSETKPPVDIRIQTHNFTLTPQGSTNLVIAKTNGTVLVQNYAPTKIIINQQTSTNPQSSNPSDTQETMFIASQQSAHVVNNDGNLSIDTITTQEADILISKLQNASISQTYDLYVLDDSSHTSTWTSLSDPSDILSDIDKKQNSTNYNPTIIWLNFSRGSTSNTHHSHTQILAQGDPVVSTSDTPQDSSQTKSDQTASSLINQAKVSIEYINDKYNTSQTNTVSSQAVWLPEVQLRPLLSHDVSIQIIAILWQIRDLIDNGTPAIDHINNSFDLLSQSLLIQTPPISSINQIPQILAQIQKELDTYTIDPKIKHQLRRLESSYQRYLRNQMSPQHSDTIQTLPQSWWLSPLSWSIPQDSSSIDTRF